MSTHGLAHRLADREGPLGRGEAGRRPDASHRGARSGPVRARQRQLTIQPRNRAVAAGLHRAGFGTLLLDLLTEDEEREDIDTARHRFDIDLLARRLTDAVDWLERRPDTADLPVGLFGASTGAGAALAAAAGRPKRVSAVVSRGGRPDLAGDALPQVTAPVLLIVGGSDTTVLELNREAAEELSAPHRLHVVPGATHLFPEPGALEQVTEAAADWFRDHMAGGG